MHHLLHQPCINSVTSWCIHELHSLLEFASSLHQKEISAISLPLHWEVHSEFEKTKQQAHAICNDLCRIGCTNYSDWYRNCCNWERCYRVNANSMPSPCKLCSKIDANNAQMHWMSKVAVCTKYFNNIWDNGASNILSTFKSENVAKSNFSEFCVVFCNHQNWPWKNLHQLHFFAFFALCTIVQNNAMQILHHAIHDFWLICLS